MKVEEAAQTEPEAEEVPKDDGDENFEDVDDEDAEQGEGGEDEGEKNEDAGEDDGAGGSSNDNDEAASEGGIPVNPETDIVFLGLRIYTKKESPAEIAGQLRHEMATTFAGLAVIMDE